MVCRYRDNDCSRAVGGRGQSARVARAQLVCPAPGPDGADAVPVVEGGRAVRSTMMDIPLSVTSIMRHGTSAYADSEVVTLTTTGSRRQTYRETGARVARLAHALRSLGIDGDQRVATLMWNNAEHLEAYLAIPSMGAVLHTLNLRLDPQV